MGNDAGRAVRGAEISGPFYLDNALTWLKRRDEIFVTDDKVAVHTYDDALVLPLRKVKDASGSPDSVYEGGVCAADGRFVAGHVRNVDNPRTTMTVTSAYEVAEDEVQRRDEDVVFGGVVFSHFGHQLVESTARLWYALDDPGDLRKIVFVAISMRAIADADFSAIAALAGIDPSRLEIVEKSTRFAHVTVPDQAFFIHSGADTRCRSVFRAMSARAQGPSAEKVYLSRSLYVRDDCVNERFLEDFHRARGFQVVHPETLPFEQQVALVAGAKEVATTGGTMSHLFLFAAPEAKLTVFLRSRTMLEAQLVVDKLMGRQPAYVLVSRSCLPTYHQFAAFLLGPTVYFRAWLADEGIACSEEELQSYEPKSDDYLEFLRRYDKAFSRRDFMLQPAQWEWDMQNVLVTLHAGLNDTTYDWRAYNAASAVKALRASAAPPAVETEDGDGAEPEDAAPILKLTSGRYERGRLRLRFRTSLSGAPVAYRAVLVERATKERRAVVQGESSVEGEVVTLDLDVARTAAGLAVGEDGASCRRWDLMIAVPGCLCRLQAEPGTRPYTGFVDWFSYEEGRLVVPGVYDDGSVCLWAIGGPDADVPGAFFGYRPDRPLVSNLLLQVLCAGRWDLVAPLRDDFEAARLRCEPRPDRRVAWRGESFEVGQYAYLQAELGVSRAVETPAKPSLRARLVRAARRAARAVGMRRGRR